MLLQHSEMLTNASCQDLSGALAVRHCGQERCRGGHSWGPAVRRHYLLHLVLEGRGSFEVDGQHYDLGPGQAFLIRPGQLVYYAADRDNPWHYCWVGFCGTEARRLLEGLNAGKGPIFSFHGREEALRYALRIKAEIQAGGSRFEALGFLYRFLALLERRSVSSCGRNAAEAAAGYFLENYSYPVTVTQAAAYAGVCRSLLFRQFKEHFGLSPQQYLQAVRLRKALELLSQGLSVTQAAYSAGFGDVSHFSRTFKAAFGAPPSQWRNCSKDGSAQVHAVPGP